MLQRTCLTVLLSCAVASCALQGPPGPLPPAGTVLDESSTNLGHGFRKVTRSVVNPPGSFEGIGHFSYVYYRDEQLCRCAQTEIVISPDGAHAVFASGERWQLVLYDTATSKRTELTQDFAGYPSSARWDLEHRRVEVQLQLGKQPSIAITF